MWYSEPLTRAQAWIDLVLNANHEDGTFWVRGIEVLIKRGQIGWSEITMSKKWRWSRNKTRSFLFWLKNHHQIEQQKNSVTSITTIVNYDKYQQQTEQQKVQQKDNRRYTNKNDKNILLDKSNNADGGEDKKNPLVERVIERFVSFYGFQPTDKKPRFEAYNLVRRMTTMLKQRNRPYDESVMLKAIDAYFAWVSEQEWAQNIQNLGTIRRKLNIFESKI